MVERLLDENRRAGRLRTRVRKPAEPERAIVADEPVLVIRPPRGFLEPVPRIGIEPAPWEPVLVSTPLPRPFGQPPHQGGAGHLVCIDSEDPLARALRVQPGKVALEVREIHTEHPVSSCGVLLEAFAIGARVGGDHNLVRHGPKRPENRSHARAGIARQAAHRQRHVGQG